MVRSSEGVAQRCSVKRERDSGTGVFLRVLQKILRTPFFTERPWRLPLDLSVRRVGRLISEVRFGNFNDQHEKLIFVNLVM